MKNFLLRLRQSEDMKARFREIENALDLPKNSIRSEYERTLVLSGMKITEVNATYNELLQIATETPYSLTDVISVHERVKSVDKVRKVLQFASQRIVNPHLVIDLMQKSDSV